MKNRDNNIFIYNHGNNAHYFRNSFAASVRSIGFLVILIQEKVVTKQTHSAFSGFFLNT